jgi:heme-degrading monooxygenase HmoA
LAGDAEADPLARARGQNGALMIAVIFEVWPAEGRASEYFDLAAALRAELAEIDGFVSVERFQSVTTPGKYLSLSFWRDERAVAAWRNGHAHRHAQAAGRKGIFADYRIRVAEVVRDYGMKDRENAPPDSARAHGTHAIP